MGYELLRFFLNTTRGYPAVTIRDDAENIVGFAFLHAYRAGRAFSRAAKSRTSYFRIIRARGSAKQYSNNSNRRPGNRESIRCWRIYPLETREVCGFTGSMVSRSAGDSGGLEGSSARILMSCGCSWNCEAPDRRQGRLEHTPGGKQRRCKAHEKDQDRQQCVCLPHADGSGRFHRAWQGKLHGRGMGFQG